MFSLCNHVHTSAKTYTTFCTVSTEGLSYSSKVKTVWTFASIPPYLHGMMHKHRVNLTYTYLPVFPGHWMYDGCQNVKYKLWRKCLFLAWEYFGTCVVRKMSKTTGILQTVSSRLKWMSIWNGNTWTQGWIVQCISNIRWVSNKHI